MNVDVVEKFGRDTFNETIAAKDLVVRAQGFHGVATVLDVDATVVQATVCARASAVFFI